MSFKHAIRDIASLPYYHLYRRFLPTCGSRILIYHSLGTKLPWGDYGISIDPKIFKEHIIFLAQHYKIIPIHSIPTSLAKSTLSITLDDGYKDNMLAYELFEELGIPYTIYISTQFIGQQYWLNQAEIKTLAKSTLCTLGTHGHSHTKLATLAPQEQYHELKTSKEILENLIGKEVIHMSYPHGSYNQNTLEIAKELGYRFCSSSHIGLNTQSSLDFFRLKRSEVIASDNIENLNKKIKGYYDFLALREGV